MEDPDSDEWEIQEYPSLKEGDEPSTVKWILNKGCRIGKKIVITGIAITCAPIVLPPLVVFSAMGVAFSVPFGLVYASYACTNKLMRTLLPIPPSPLMLEYYGDDYDQEKEDEVECRFELDDGAGDYRILDINKKGYYTNKEEKVLDDEGTEDLNQGVDMVFELDDNYMRQGEALVVDVDKKSYNSSEYEGNELGKENVMQEDEEERISDGYGNEVKALVSHVDEDVKEKGYYSDEEKIESEGTDDKLRPGKVDNERMEDINQGADVVLELDDGGNDTRELREAVVVNVDENFDEKSYYTNENDNEREMEVLVHLMENAVREEEREQMEDIKQGVEMRLGLDMAPDECKQTEEGTITSIDGGVDDKGYEQDVGESLEGDVDSLEEEQKGNELLIESHLDENRSNAPVVTSYDKGKEGSGVVKGDYSIDETASNVILEEVTDDETADPVTVKEIETQKIVEDESKNEEPVGEMRHIVVLASGNADNNFNAREVEEIDLVAREVRGDAKKHERDTKSDEEVIRESMGTQEKLISDMSNGPTEDAILETKKEHLTNLNADAREIGDESGLDLFDDNNTSIYFEILEAGDEAKKNTFNDDVDFMAIPAFRQPLLETDKAQSASKVYTKMSSREDILDDEKIWEKLGAMRAIVGYKAPSQPTCIRELKALYVFTGVEPPASYKGDSDLDEVNAKLKFLMSIVGVK
ncbi:hypothetical protein CTI12_AA068190 [Artemisia annua]|uniref:Uncharacterized protein n=1 Tax=Artemisia annua TaxID=35608 RepID=A0A2U1Q4M6_ARTAN|nr:hypothetical protein CTI12_AA068190 [Artemisia annua]